MLDCDTGGSVLDCNTGGSVLDCNTAISKYCNVASLSSRFMKPLLEHILRHMLTGSGVRSS